MPCALSLRRHSNIPALQVKSGHLVHIAFYWRTANPTHRLPHYIDMTKDWELVQDEIKELSFVQKKPLDEVKELMERKHKFRAS